MPTKSDPKICFVVGPIGRAGTPERNHADWLNDGIIKPLFVEHFPTFRTLRADEINAPGMIDAQVINQLFDADLVISDMSLRNANAFYEMGIRHAVQKPIIHMFKVGEDIPFDVNPYRAIEFSFNHPSDIQLAKDRLKAAVEQVLLPSYKADNPVIRARGLVELEKTATAPERVLIDRFSELENRISRIEVLQDRRPKRRNVIYIAFREKMRPSDEQMYALLAEVNLIIPTSSARVTDAGYVAVDTSAPAAEAVSRLERVLKSKFSWVGDVSEIPF